VAPGKVSTTADGWLADNTKAAFLGMTAHWIEVKNDKWALCSEVVGFQSISGGHDGNNLGRYFMGLCDRVGICGQNESKVCCLCCLVCCVWQRVLVIAPHLMDAPLRFAATVDYIG
jgi:hypothetical protein